jgi:excisionase family DNA binding protein
MARGRKQAADNFSTWLTKAEAVAQTGLGERTIERLMAKGVLKFAHRRVPGRKPLAVIDPNTLEAIKKETVSATPLVPTVMRARKDTRALSLRPLPARLAITQDVPLTEKFFLTLEEAVRLSGLPENYLKRLIANGKLEAIRSGGWRIRRRDLATL